MTPVHPGQKLKIPASDWNDLGDVLTAFNGAGRKFPAPPPADVPLPYGWCWIKSSVALAFGAVVGLDVPTILPTDRANIMYEGVFFNGVTPSTSTPHYGKYAVVQEPCNAGGMARAVFHGVAYATLSITHALDQAAEIENGSYVLKTGYVGTSRIIWPSSVLGGGLIRVGDTLDNFFGKPNASISSGATNGVVNAWKPDFTGSALGPTITGCCYFGTATLTTSDKVSGCVVAGIPVIGKLC